MPSSPPDPTRYVPAEEVATLVGRAGTRESREPGRTLWSRWRRRWGGLRTPLFLLIFPFDLRSLPLFIDYSSCTHKLKLFDYSSCGHKLKHLTYKVRPVAPPTLGTVGDGPPRDGPGLGATNGCAWARWEAPATRPGRGRHHNETRAPRVGLSRASQAHLARSQPSLLAALGD